MSLWLLTFLALLGWASWGDALQVRKPSWSAPLTRSLFAVRRGGQLSPRSSATPLSLVNRSALYPQALPHLQPTQSVLPPLGDRGREGAGRSSTRVCSRSPVRMRWPAPSIVRYAAALMWTTLPIEPGVSVELPTCHPSHPRHRWLQCSQPPATCMRYTARATREGAEGPALGKSHFCNKL